MLAAAASAATTRRITKTCAIESSLPRSNGADILRLRFRADRCSRIRVPGAFSKSTQAKPELQATEPINSSATRKGCNCKTGCQKGYCVCFLAGTGCVDGCACTVRPALCTCTTVLDALPVQRCSNPLGIKDQSEASDSDPELRVKLMQKPQKLQRPKKATKRRSRRIQSAKASVRAAEEAAAAAEEKKLSKKQAKSFRRVPLETSSSAAASAVKAASASAKNPYRVSKRKAQEMEVAAALTEQQELSAAAAALTSFALFADTPALPNVDMLASPSSSASSSSSSSASSSALSVAASSPPAPAKPERCSRGAECRLGSCQSLHPCQKCLAIDKWKPLEAFGIDMRQWKGKRGRRYESCKQCRERYSRSMQMLSPAARAASLSPPPGQQSSSQAAVALAVADPLSDASNPPPKRRRLESGAAQAVVAQVASAQPALDAAAAVAAALASAVVDTPLPSSSS